MEDTEIIRRIRQGDVESYSLLVLKYHRNLLRFVHRLAGDPALAEDLGQEIFLSVYRSLGSFDETRGVPFSAWLFIAARNRCVTELRRKKAWVGLDDVGETPSGARCGEADLLRKELGQAIAETLGQLDEPFRSTIVRSLQGDSIGQIAAADGIPAGTVKSRLSRARQRVQGMLKRLGWEG